MFPAPKSITAEVFSRLPDAHRLDGVHTEWSRSRGGSPLHSFLEGPSFDRQGTLYCVDLNHSRIFRISPRGEWSVFAHYDGGPNGLKIHRDGRIFVTDRKAGIVALDPVSAERTVICNSHEGRPLNGTNDLFFAPNGDLYFTDPGVSSLKEPNGRVLRIAADGKVETVADYLAYPNGLAMSPDGHSLYVAVTRSLQIVRISLLPDQFGVTHYRSNVFLNLAGGSVGPDGMAIDRDGSLAIAQAGLGTVWLFNKWGEPILRILSPAGRGTTNVAYGGEDGRDLFIIESEQGLVLRTHLDVPGVPMYSHA